MHKWQKLDRTKIILCDRCSKKEYKVLDIRERWKKTEMNQKVSCELCGLTETISSGTPID